MKPSEIAKRLDRDIQPDLVPELEAVGHSFRGAINANPDPCDEVFLDAIPEALAGQMDETEPRAALFGPPGLSIDGHPHLVRVLGREALEAERRQEAEDPSRNTARSNRKAVPLGQDRTRQRVETPFDALNDAAVAETAQLRTGDAHALELVCPCDSALSQQRRRPFARDSLCHNTSVIESNDQEFVTHPGRTGNPVLARHKRRQLRASADVHVNALFHLTGSAEAAFRRPLWLKRRWLPMDRTRHRQAG